MTAAAYHIPVMRDQSIDLLVTDPDGIYVDGTLGAGGHAAALLDKLGPKAKVYGIDHDDEALNEARAHISDSDRFETIKGNFGFLETLLPPDEVGKVSGILLDLGVSSHQIDEQSRGFSFQQDGPLDMRMSNLRSLTAEDVVNTYPYEKLRDIIFHYGEERQSREIAREIIARRPLSTTAELKACVEQVVKGRFQVKSLARVFQAIRIEVNQELEMLRNVLRQAVNVLKDGGRVVVISYHSLEDRIVKNFFRAGNDDGKTEKDFYGNVVRPFEPLNTKVITANKDEIRENPRARSAKIRVAVKKGEVKHVR